MAFGGLALKSTQTLLRTLQLLGSILILGIFSYFLAAQANHGLFKAAWVKAVEGIAGAAILWTLFALLLTCFVGGVTAFGALALILDVLFFGAFIAVTILTRAGRRSCNGFISTPLGSGDTRTGVVTTRPPNRNYTPNLKRICRLQKAVFAVSIILFVLFLLTALVQIMLVRHHKKEKRYGPSPANNYTTGSGSRGFFRRNKANNTVRDAELATAGATTTVPPTTTTTTTAALETEKHNHQHMRPSQETGYTGYTGSTVAQQSDGYNGVKTIHGGVPPVNTQTYSAGAYGGQTGGYDQTTSSSRVQY